ncbi:MAG: hypothetical protein ACLT98_08935 [Eggerthellaceae bacterium]
MPNDAVALALIEEGGLSPGYVEVLISGEPPAHTFDELNPELLAKVPLRSATGARVAVSSTVVDCTGTHLASYASAPSRLTILLDSRNLRHGCFRLQGRCCSACVHAVRSSMTRSMNDDCHGSSVAVHGRIRAQKRRLAAHALHGVWPSTRSTMRSSDFRRFDTRLSLGGPCGASSASLSLRLAGHLRSAAMLPTAPNASPRWQYTRLRPERRCNLAGLGE